MMIIVCDGKGSDGYCPKSPCDNCGGIRDGYPVVRDTVAVSSAMAQIKANENSENERGESMKETDRQKAEYAGIDYIKRNYRGNIGAQMVSAALLKSSLDNDYDKDGNFKS